MNVTDFILGFTLINALPHFVFGVWKGRAPSLFGTGPGANLAYSALNLTVSIALFLHTYGLAGFQTQGIYVGGLFIVVSYLLVGVPLERHFRPSPTTAAAPVPAR